MLYLTAMSRDPKTGADDLIEDFRRKYEYDPVPWLPVLSAKVVGSEGRYATGSCGICAGLLPTGSHTIMLEVLGALSGKRTQNMVDYGHWGFPSEFLMYGGQSHDVAGEFWNEGELGNIECRAASYAAHIMEKDLYRQNPILQPVLHTSVIRVC